MTANCAHLFIAVPCLPVVVMMMSACSCYDDVCHAVKLIVVSLFETR